MSNPSLQVIPHIVDQHIEEAAFLWSLRAAACHEPHYDLDDLAKLDQRVAAHLDGIAVSGEYGYQICKMSLQDASANEIFVSTVHAIESKNYSWLDKQFSVANLLPEVFSGFVSAFGWVSAQFLEGIVVELLRSEDPFRRLIGLSACSMHRVNPGKVLQESLRHTDSRLRACAYRVSAELGCKNLLAECLLGLQDKDFSVRFQAAWSAVLLGDRGLAIQALERFVHVPNMYQEQAVLLLLKVLSLTKAQHLLATIGRNPLNKRIQIRGAGVAGDAQYIPWLIKQLEKSELSRLAGESIALITGLDLAYLDFEQEVPEHFEILPTDNAEDNKIAQDQDENLPWPNQTKLKQWWLDNNSSYQHGLKYLMGKPLNKNHCIQVLKAGNQRQRQIAAQHLSIIEPGEPLFSVKAPAWRQKRWIKKYQ